MTDMFYDGRYPITLSGKEYHLLFSLKVLSELQNEVIANGKESLPDFISGIGSYDHFGWLLTRLINEGAAPDEEPMTEETLSKLAHPGTHAMLREAIYKAYVGKGPNEPLVDLEDMDEDEGYEDEDDEPEDEDTQKNAEGGKNE